MPGINNKQVVPKNGPDVTADQGAAEAGPAASDGGGTTEGNDVTDVEYEEVDDKK